MKRSGELPKGFISLNNIIKFFKIKKPATRFRIVKITHTFETSRIAMFILPMIVIVAFLFKFIKFYYHSIVEIDWFKWPISARLPLILDFDVSL